MADESRNNEPVWNYLSDEDFQTYSTNLTTVLGDNPTALAQFADIIGDIRNLREELGRRDGEINRLNSTLNNITQSNIELMSRRVDYSRGETTAERRAVADSEARRANGEFAGYPSRNPSYGSPYGNGNNFVNRGYNGFNQVSDTVGTIGPEDPGVPLIEDLMEQLLDERGNRRG